MGKLNQHLQVPKPPRRGNIPANMLLAKLVYTLVDQPSQTQDENLKTLNQNIEYYYKCDYGDADDKLLEDKLIELLKEREDAIAEEGEKFQGVTQASISVWRKVLTNVLIIGSAVMMTYRRVSAIRL